MSQTHNLVKPQLTDQLLLLKEIVKLLNCGQDINSALLGVLEHLQCFYAADGCLLILRESNNDRYRLHRAAARVGHNDFGTGEVIDAEFAALLLAIPPTYAVTCTSLPEATKARYEAFDVASGDHSEIELELCEGMLNLLGVSSLLSVPACCLGNPVGRLHLTSQSKIFQRLDAEFLHQAVELTMLAVHNSRLTDKITNDAAEQERKRVALDIHDSVIQPYIGLQLGLTAVRDKLKDGHKDVSADVERLLELTTNEIAAMRRIVHRLKDSRRGENDLLAAVNRFARKFEDTTGISVRVESCDVSNESIGNYLAAEVFQIIAEALSNIRRHTNSRQAWVKLAVRNNYLVVCIENKSKNEQPSLVFAPRSITERSTALGGCVDINQTAEVTTVRVQLPLK